MLGSGELIKTGLRCGVWLVLASGVNERAMSKMTLGFQGSYVERKRLRICRACNEAGGDDSKWRL